MAATACAVVCNGGSSTTAQALLRGIPVVGIAHNLDQYLNMHYIERFGAGTLLRADRTRADAVRNATRRAMEDPHMRERAGAIAALAAGIQSDIEFPVAIRLLLDSEPQSPAKLTASATASRGREIAKETVRYRRPHESRPRDE